VDRRSDPAVSVDGDLVAALTEAQRLGFLGDRPIPEVISHARSFVRALAAHEPIESVLDLGSGGGVPGLVIAHDRPNTRVTLLDRRSKRTDVLERVVRRWGWQARVNVVCGDAATFEHVPFDAVVARGFGPPELTLALARRSVRSGGVIVISEPPGGDRWDDDVLAKMDVHRALGPNTGAGSSMDRSSTELAGRVAVFVADDVSRET